MSDDSDLNVRFIEFVGRAVGFVFSWTLRLIAGAVALILFIYLVAWIIERAGEPGRVKATANEANANAHRALGQIEYLEARVADLEDRLGN